MKNLLCEYRIICFFGFLLLVSGKVSGQAPINPYDLFPGGIGDGHAAYELKYKTLNGAEPEVGLPLGSDFELCGGGVALLSATPGNNANTVYWYESLNSTVPLATTTDFQVDLSSSEIFWVASVNETTGVRSNKVSMNVFVKYANAGIDQFISDVTSSPGLDANNPTGEGVWSLKTGEGNFEDATDPNTIVNGIGYGLNTYTWTLLGCNSGVSSDDVNLYFLDYKYPGGIGDGHAAYESKYKTLNGAEPDVGLPVVSDFELCGGGVALLSATPGNNANTVYWYESLNSTEPLATTTDFEVDLTSSEKFWVASVNETTGLKSYKVSASVYVHYADAGPDQFLSDTLYSPRLNANNPTGEGVWSLKTGDGFFEDFSNPNTIVKRLGYGLNTYTWTLLGCNSGVSSDDVNLYFLDYKYPGGIGDGFGSNDVKQTYLGGLPCSPPEVITKDITVSLDENGFVQINPENVDNGSSSECSIQSRVLSQNGFDCTDIGANIVTLTLTDEYGSYNQANASVVVIDDLDPVPDIAILPVLEGECFVNVSVFPTATDNCKGKITASTTDPLLFENQGIFYINWKFDDGNGNQKIQTQKIVVNDQTPPTAVCKNIDVQLDGLNEASVLIDDIEGVSYDNCAIFSSEILTGQTNYTCLDAGLEFEVELKVTDVNGMSGTCTSKVMVLDDLNPCNQPPVAACQNITVGTGTDCVAKINANQVDNGSSDPDLDVLIYSLDNDGPFSIGEHKVSLIVSDPSGESDQCEATVTVEDNTPPKAACKNLTVYLNVDGEALIKPDQIDNGSTDNCGTVNLFNVLPNSFTCADVGVNIVTLTVTDNNGNVSTCKAEVTVEDNVAPVSLCKTATVQLDASGNGSITAANIDDGSNDACDIKTLSVAPNSFTCADVGTNIVTLTVTDNNNNVSTCTAEVTVGNGALPNVAMGDIFGSVEPAFDGKTFESSTLYGDGTITFPVNAIHFNGNKLFEYEQTGNEIVANLEATNININFNLRVSFLGATDNLTGTAEIESISGTVLYTINQYGNLTVSVTPVVNIGNIHVSYNGGVANFLNVFTPLFINILKDNMESAIIELLGNPPYSLEYIYDSSVEFTVSEEGCQGEEITFTDLSVVSPGATYLWDFGDGETSNVAGDVTHIYETSGDFTATLTVTEGVCEQSYPKPITVNPIPEVTLNPFDPVCPGTEAFELTGGSPQGGAYSGDFVTDGFFNPVGSGQGTFIIEYSVENDFGCIGSASQSLTVGTGAPAQIVFDDVFTVLESGINGLTIEGSNTYGEGIVTFPSNALHFNGAKQFAYEQNGNEISVSLSVTDIAIDFNLGLTVELIPGFPISDDLTGDVKIGYINGTALYLVDENGNLTVSGTPVLNIGNITISYLDGGTFAPFLTIFEPLISNSLSDELHTTLINWLQSPTFTFEEIYDTSVDFFVSKEGCQGAEIDFTDLSVVSPGATYLWDFGDEQTSTISSNVSHIYDTEGDYFVTLTVTEGECEQSYSNQVLIHPSPIVTLEEFEPVCPGTAPFALTGGYPVDGTYRGDFITDGYFDPIESGQGTFLVEYTLVNEFVCEGKAKQSISIEDNMLPTALCQDVTVQLDANGNGILTPADVDNNSTDACGIADLALDLTSFSCTDVGNENIVTTLTVKDVNGNQSTCTAKVTVEDNVSPAASCQDVTVQLDANGNGILTQADVDNNSTDACGIADLALDLTSFSCTDVGNENIVTTLAVKDVNGNQSTCTAKVTVEDNVPPAITCVEGDSRYVDPYKTYYTVTVEEGEQNEEIPEFDATTDDACGIQSLTYFCETASIITGTSLTAVTLPLGDNTITWTAVDESGNTNSCETVVTVEKRPTTLTYNGDLEAQYSDETNLSALLVDIDGYPVKDKTITFKIGNGITSQSATGTTNARGIASATLVVTQDPAGSYTVKAEFMEDAGYLGSSDEPNFDITPEDACYVYTGSQFSTVDASGDVDLLLTATVFDSGDDGNPGDLTNATAKIFILDEDLNTIDWYTCPITLDPNNHAIGYISHDYPFNIGSEDALDYYISVEINGYYITNEEECDGMGSLHLYKADGEFITGGGHIQISDSYGTFTAEEGTKTNFGYHIKWNKTMKNLQGKMNIIFRRKENDGILHIYQIKTNATRSLGIANPEGGCTFAEFTSKCNLIDITDPLNPYNVGEGVELRVITNDCGEPGINDAIGITVWDKNTLLYSSNWDGKETLEQPLDGGNLIVHTNANKAAEIVTGVELEFQLADLKVYPNPFDDHLRFEFISPETVQAKIDIYDMTGRHIETVFDNFIEGGTMYNAEFKPMTVISAMYFYRMTMGNAVYNGKVVYKKE